MHQKGYLLIYINSGDFRFLEHQRHRQQRQRRTEVFQDVVADQEIPTLLSSKHVQSVWRC